MRFNHLHCHSSYSLLDGQSKIPLLVKHAKANGMEAIAVTDHGNLHGMVELLRECKSQGVKPIVGMEAYVAPGSRLIKERSGGVSGKESSFHLTLLAKNGAGVRNLMRLSSHAFISGYYYKPRIDHDLLEELSEGLICLSGCVSSDFSDLLLGDRIKEAEARAAWYHRVFKDDFYIEIQNNGVQIQADHLPRAVDLANRMGLPLVGTSDAHYLTQPDSEAHDILLCINMGKTVDDPNRMKFDTDQFHVRTPDEMLAAMPEFREALERTAEIADGVEENYTSFGLGKRCFPSFETPGTTPEDYLRKIAHEGAIKRYGSPSAEVLTRLDHELNTICQMGFASYFLIVHDIVRFMVEQGIPNSARGSACGAVTSYVLWISHVDPLVHQLLFERFLDPSRSEAPDIDLDICQERREVVFEYVRRKYGEDRVAQIGTFGTMAARSVIRDVGRAMGYQDAPKLSILIPEGPKVTIASTLESEPRLAEAMKDPAVAKLIDLAQRIEGTARNISTHAAGVVITPTPLIDLVPLQIIPAKKDGKILTQWNMGDIEKAGLLKMDFLGLRNLTILDRAVRIVNSRHPAIDLMSLPLDDPETYELLQRGETKGVFQLESSGIRELLVKMKPDHFNDIIAVAALYRPGPLEGGMVASYVERKHGRETWEDAHPVVTDILNPTYGVMVYQEQVMLVLHKLGGIPLTKAYATIKAISKKKTEEIEAGRKSFVDGATAMGVEESVATAIFEKIVVFGGYGFNKCVNGDTSIVDAASGERTTIKDLFLNRREFRVHSIDKDDRVVVRRVKDVVWNGVRQTYRLTTRTGRSITATDNHPFRVFSGWRELGDLEVGDLIATPRCMPASGYASMPRHEIIALAGLLSEGNTCHPTSLYFYNNNVDNINDFADAIGMFPATVANAKSYDGRKWQVCANTGPTGELKANIPKWEERFGVETIDRLRSMDSFYSGAYRWSEGLGLLGKKAPQKSIPDVVFTLNETDLRLFVGRLWSGDGFFSCEDNFTPYYATASLQLAKDVRDILIRLGMTSTLKEKRFKYRGGIKIGYTVHLIGNGAIERFIDVITPHTVGFDEDIERLKSYHAEHGNDQSNAGIIPIDVRHLVDAERRKAGLTWLEFEEDCGVCNRDFRSPPARKKGFRQSIVAKIAAFFGNEELDKIAHSDIYWDEVVSIEPCGVEDVYDLEIDTDDDNERNFVADGIIVHNSHSCAYALLAYHTAYMKAHYPTEFMAALLSSELNGQNRSHLTQHLDDARRMGIEVMPPDVNSGGLEFHVADEGKIRFGLGAIKGIGPSVINSIVASRTSPYRDITDLMVRVDLTPGYAETLIQAGALDSLGFRRSQALAVLPAAHADAKVRRRKRGQARLFDDSAELNAPDIPEIPEDIRLAHEKAALEFYVSGHPLLSQGAIIEPVASQRICDLEEYADREEVFVAGMIASMETRTLKNSRSEHSVMANIVFEDMGGSVPVVVWPETFNEYRDVLRPDLICLVRATIDRRREKTELVASGFVTIEESGAYAKNVVVRIVDRAEELHAAALANPGATPLMIETPFGTGRIAFKTNLHVDFAGLMADTEDFATVRLIGPPKPTIATRRFSADDDD